MYLVHQKPSMQPRKPTCSSASLTRDANLTLVRVSDEVGNNLKHPWPPCRHSYWLSLLSPFRRHQTFSNRASGGPALGRPGLASRHLSPSLSKLVDHTQCGIVVMKIIRWIFLFAPEKHRDLRKFLPHGFGKLHRVWDAFLTLSPSATQLIR